VLCAPIFDFSFSAFQLFSFSAFQLFSFYQPCFYSQCTLPPLVVGGWAGPDEWFPMVE